MGIESIQEFRQVDTGTATGNDSVYQTDKSIDEKPAQFQMECGVNNGGFTTQVSTAQLTKSQSKSSLDTTTKLDMNDSDATFRSPVTYQNNTNIQGSSCNYLLDFFLCFSLLR